jgi:nucleoside-diphosphate-sugar epimerase
VTCLVTGATGNVGSLVTQRLIARGDRPRVFVRDPKKARELFGDRAEIRVGDLADIQVRSLASATSFCPTVVPISRSEIGPRRSPPRPRECATWSSSRRWT